MMSPEQKYAREHQTQHGQLQSPAFSQPDGQALLQEMQGQQAKVHREMLEAEHRMEVAEHLLQEAAQQVQDAANSVHDAEHRVHEAEHRVHEAEHQVHEAEHEVHEAEHDMQLVDQQMQEAVEQQTLPKAELPSLGEEAHYHHRPCRSLHDSESLSVQDCMSFDRFRNPWRNSSSPRRTGSKENMAAAGFVAPRSIPLGQDMADRRAATPPLSYCDGAPAAASAAPDDEGGKGDEDDEEESAYDQLRKAKNAHTPLW